MHTRTPPKGELLFWEGSEAPEADPGGPGGGSGGLGSGFTKALSVGVVVTWRLLSFKRFSKHILDEFQELPNNTF